MTRDRDAWATIDGFVYQVVVTVERWLSLADDEVLELERGEDIDVVIDSIANTTDDDERFRRLEQVKRLSANVTLRSPSIVEFIASAVEHRQNNPGTTLYFRFVSTASPGTERPSPFRPAKSAIQVWTRLARAHDPKDEREALAGIRSLLRSAQRPADFNPATWSTYREFVDTANNTSFVAFMTSVEWALDSGDRREIERSIQSGLVARKLVPSEEAAESAYRNLFFEVFRVLSQPGLKRLTPADLGAALKGAPRTANEVAAELRFLALLGTLDARLAQAERELAIQRQQIDRLAQLQQLPTRVRATPATFLPPPLVDGAVKRPQLIAE